MTLLLSQDNLPELTRQKFKTALATGELIFRRTEVTILLINDIPFQLRFCPSLTQKPSTSSPSSTSTSTPVKRDPFDSPSAALFITDVGSPPSHFVLLNKFAIVPHHFILATKAFKEQTWLLERDDWTAVWTCMRAWESRGEKVFGFFNSGPHSGASQAHRHVQFLPRASMMVDVEEGDWHPLVERMSTDPHLDLPFTYFGTALPLNPTEVQLHNLYMSLHRQACHAMLPYLSKSTEDDDKISVSEVQSPISYNLGFTTTTMVLIPRRAEGAMIPTGLNEPEVTGPIALNGTVLAGTLLVKNEMEWQILKRDASKLLGVLEAIGIAPAEDKVRKP